MFVEKYLVEGILFFFILVAVFAFYETLKVFKQEPPKQKYLKKGELYGTMSLSIEPKMGKKKEHTQVELKFVPQLPDSGEIQIFFNNTNTKYKKSAGGNITLVAPPTSNMSSQDIWVNIYITSENESELQGFYENIFRYID